MIGIGKAVLLLEHIPHDFGIAADPVPRLNVVRATLDDIGPDAAALSRGQLRYFDQRLWSPPKGGDMNVVVSEPFDGEESRADVRSVAP
jgi:hypothetical protein